MNNSAEKKNPEVFPENKIGGSHWRKSLISLNNQPNTTHQKTKQNKNLQSQNMRSQGVKLTFFSDSHLAPEFFKVVANSKKVGRHFQRQTKSFFTLSAF